MHGRSGRVQVRSWIQPTFKCISAVSRRPSATIPHSVLKGRWHEEPVEPVWGHLQSIAWAAGGKGFFVTSWQPDSFNLLHVTFAGRVKPLLRNHRQWMHNPLPSPDGKYLSFGAQTWDSNVSMLENF